MGDVLMVTKADGSTEPFHMDKLRSSLRRSGVEDATIDDIVVELEPMLRGVVTTEGIYQKAFALLKKYHRHAASRYSLRRALFGFGPTGFPFEDFVAAIFQAKGYKTATRVMLRGRCVEHEMDMIATKDGQYIAAELKFHNDIGYKSDVKVALYIHARFLDILEGAKNDNIEHPVTESWLITNTKFTDQAIKYGSCAGLTMVGWSYPDKGNLQDLIEEAGIHPLTCLTTLSKTEKMRLLEQNIVLCKALPDNPDLLRNLGLSEAKIKKVLDESALLCQPGAGR